MIKVAIIGAGHRGRMAYARNLNRYDDVSVVSLVDRNKLTLTEGAKEFNISDKYLFLDSNSFFNTLKKEKFCDAVVIATTDQEHYDIAIEALNNDLHILLEKPISPFPNEVLNIDRLAKGSDKVIMICHVLRYTSFFNKIKEIIDDGIIGDIVNIIHTENIGYYHFAHSYVRGNWKIESESAPMILAKSCHDMDILLYLTGKQPIEINSFGSLKYFNSNNKPVGASHRCLKCKYQDKCLYSVKKFYTTYPGIGWRDLVDVTMDDNNLYKKLLEGPYGVCVWDNDNDVCDNQVADILFEDNIVATMNISAFNNEIHRDLKIMGTKGELYADELEKDIIVKVFGESKYRKYSHKNTDDGTGGDSGHGGGDEGIVKAFVDAIKGDKDKIKSDVEESVMSHIMCFAAEKSRKNKERVNIKEFIGELDVFN